MRTCFSMDPLTVDPRKSGDVISSAFVFMLYDGLMQLLPDGKIEFSLAKSVDISEDGCTYVFHLRQAKWSDGHPITAFDFEHSWKKTLEPSFPSSCPELFFPIKKAEAASQGNASLDEVGIMAIDRQTLKVELQHPTPYFLALTCCYNFFPIPQHIEAANPSWDIHFSPCLISNGPFRLVKWKQKREITVEKNPFYWDAENTSLSKLHISIIKNEFATLEMFENGELDWVSSMLAALPLSSLKGYQQERKLTLNPAASTAFCAYNIHQFPFHNVHIRKALSLAIDRKHIVDEITQFDEIPAKRFVPPLLDRQDVEILNPFNPCRARKYLQKGITELGITKDVESMHKGDDLKLRLFLRNLTLSYDDIPSNRQVAQSLQEQWRRHLGFRIKLIPQSFKVQTEAIYRRDFNIALRFCFAHYNDPMSLLERFKYKNLRRNFPKFESNLYIELLNQSSQKNYVKRRRNAILLKAESHLLDNLPITPLYHGSYPVLSQSTVGGISFTAIGNVQFRKAKYLAQKSRFCEAAVS